MTLLQSVRSVVIAVAVALAVPAAAHADGDPVGDLVGGLVDGVREVVAAPGGCAGADLDPNRANVNAVRVATLCLLNAERTKRGLRPLRERWSLRHAATRYSRAMVRGDFFDHVSPRGQTMFQRISATGYVPRHRAWVLGENIGWGTNDLARPGSIVEAWMQSPPHRRNILDGQFREIGVGVVAGAPQAGVGDRGAATYTTHFGAVL